MAILIQSFQWGRYLVLGLVAGGALQLCSPVWMLAQLGGPQPFWIFCSLVVVPLLALSLVFVKSCPAGQAAVAGLLFSLPILVICFVLPFEDESAKRYFRLEMWCDGVVVMAMSSGLSVLVSKIFNRNRPEPLTAPNCGLGTLGGGSANLNGPQSVS